MLISDTMRSRAAQGMPGAKATETVRKPSVLSGEIGTEKVLRNVLQRVDEFAPSSLPLVQACSAILFVDSE